VEKTKITPGKSIRSRKKPTVISTEDKEYLKKIASTARELRLQAGFSYEAFAAHADINRNSYFRFEQSADKSYNYTIVLLLKVIRGLGMTPEEFFKATKKDDQ
jgi:transcriptional regulator with XRE-family HTH domain